MSESISMDTLENQLDFFKKMYDIARLVDPVRKKVMECRETCLGQTDEICYSYWQTGRICDNCISIRAHRDNKCYQKLEQLPEAVMLVTAFPIARSDPPVVLELLKNATDTMLIGTGTYAEGHLLSRFVSRLNNLIIRDELTGLYNRRYINDRLPADIVRATLERQPLSVAFLDIDNFKRLNDRFGHAFGDTVLKAVAGTLQNSIRAGYDWAARFGGDEFLLCFNQTAGLEAYRIAERIRMKIAQLKMAPDGMEPPAVTASFGIHTLEDTALTADELLSLADKKMFKAKQQGKNRTCRTEPA